MPRIRTIKQAYQELLNADPHTALNPHAIRKLILNGAIPAFMSGSKYLIAMENLENYISSPPLKKQDNSYGMIRQINVK